MAHMSETKSQEHVVGRPPHGAALQEIARLVGATLRVPVVVLALLDPLTGELVTRAQVGDRAEPMVSALGTQVPQSDIAAEVAARLAPALVGGADPRLSVYIPSAGPAATLACVPLMDGDDLLGTLVLASEDGRAAEAASEASYEPLCRLVASAVGAHIREELAHASAHQTAKLLSVARSLTSSLDPAHARAAAVTGIRRMIACDRVALLLRDPGDGTGPDGGAPLRGVPVPLQHDGRAGRPLGRRTRRRDIRVATLWDVPVPVMSSSDGRGERERGKTRQGQRKERQQGLDERQWALVDWVFARRHPRALAPDEVIEDGDETARQRGAVPASGDMPALYCMPLETGSPEHPEMLGVLLVARSRPFTGSEIRLLAHLAHIVAAAVENSQAHHVARIQEERLNAILASASDGMAIVDNALAMIEVNPAFARLLGHSAGELRGGRLCEAMHGDPATGCLLCAHSCLARQVLDAGEPLADVTCEFDGSASHATPRPDSPDRYAHPLGEKRTINFSLTPVAGPDGQGVLLIGRDITSAREAERMRASFLAVLSHELRQPLQSITGWIGIALEPPNLPSDPQQRTFLRRAFIASEHLSTLVDDLLLLSSRDAGTLSLQPKRQDLIPLLQQAIEEMEIRATQEEVALRLEVPETLPQIPLDGLRLSQVLRNLLANAIKFTPKGGRVTVVARETPREVVIFVRDTGIGIPEEHHQRIFERNYQVLDGSKERERYRGHGLGLAIVRIIVDGHGGSVSVESTPGKGSTFSVHLPR